MKALGLVALTLIFSFRFVSAEEAPPRISFGQIGEDMVVRLPSAKLASSWCILASSDLKHWTELGEILEINGAGDFPDALTPLPPKRLYRAIHRGRDIQVALDRNRARWERSGITDYDFTFQWICFCVPNFVEPVNLSVRQGKLESITRVSDGAEIDPAHFENYRTIDGLFDLLQDAIDQKPHSLSVRFGPRFGIPRRAWVDYQAGISDEELGFIVKALRIAKIPPVQLTDTPPAEIQLDPLQLTGASIQGHTLVVNLQHSGGCREHEYELFMSPASFLESFPVQANLYIRHHANGDLFEALLSPELRFDITPITELYGQPYSILLNVYDYFTDEPSTKIRVTYHP